VAPAVEVEHHVWQEATEHSHVYVTSNQEDWICPSRTYIPFHKQTHVRDIGPLVKVLPYERPVFSIHLTSNVKKRQTIIAKANAKQSNLNTTTEGKKDFEMYKNGAVSEKLSRLFIGLVCSRIFFIRLLFESLHSNAAIRIEIRMKAIE
jgi:hypothetical protein